MKVKSPMCYVTQDYVWHVTCCSYKNKESNVTRNDRMLPMVPGGTTIGKYIRFNPSPEKIRVDS